MTHLSEQALADLCIAMAKPGEKVSLRPTVLFFDGTIHEYRGALQAIADRLGSPDNKPFLDALAIIAIAP